MNTSDCKHTNVSLRAWLHTQSAKIREDQFCLACGVNLTLGTGDTFESLDTARAAFANEELERKARMEEEAERYRERRDRWQAATAATLREQNAELSSIEDDEKVIDTYYETPDAFVFKRKGPGIL